MKPGKVHVTFSEFRIILYSITCHEEVTLQLVFVAEVVSGRVQEKLICILAYE